MREILFRGQRVDNGEWVEGMLFYSTYTSATKFGLKICIQVVDLEKCEYHTSHEVIPETVGQFTGLTDKNGKKIFEGDKLRINRYAEVDENCYGDIIVQDIRYFLRDEYYQIKGHTSTYEVIGNIHTQKP